MARKRLERDDLVGMLREAEETAKIGAESCERIADRATPRQGFRDRRGYTRPGTLQLQVPNLIFNTMPPTGRPAPTWRSRGGSAMPLQLDYPDAG